jgi:hypothetical protein
VAQRFCTWLFQERQTLKIQSSTMLPGGTDFISKRGEKRSCMRSLSKTMEIWEVNDYMKVSSFIILVAKSEVMEQL